MKRLHLLALLGLAMADTDLRDLTRFCNTGQCPDYWQGNKHGDCFIILHSPHLNEARAWDYCAENFAEYRDRNRTGHFLPGCIMRRKIQCHCGKTLRKNRGKVMGGVDVQKNEYPWQGKVHPYRLKSTYKLNAFLES